MEPVPGFAVLVELGDFLFFVREEAQRLHDAEGVGRKDVPDIFRHDVGDEQINFVGLVEPRWWPQQRMLYPPLTLALTQCADLICTLNKRPSTSTMKS